ncbi:hypothetical protein D1818_05480 [Aquimarina sp. BL5]|uniref:hypothetical protein n=1 Tax=Aquimarina sp. BL5 TaxID=1714860 RepID=UPI000E541F4E|nr:hypothetical protein [Aquimarina sp. BL5]AXT50306.1 hypothetical protein D1818_05480 [Aquimarina sp. BL5]RKM91006.1 hypothetical protein D7036_23695 [Aquimarina sp. BL5]
MKKNNRIYIEFGIPEHGWLFMNFQWQDFSLEIDLSNVPTDPIEQLCDTLLQLSSGITNPSKVIWHLEPHCYYFEIKKLEKSYNIIISESDEFESKPVKLVKEFEGNYDQIILPLYRAIKKFNSYSYKKPHWDEMDSKRILKLTEQIKKEHNTI